MPKPPKGARMILGGTMGVAIKVRGATEVGVTTLGVCWGSSTEASS